MCGDGEQQQTVGTNLRFYGFGQFRLLGMQRVGLLVGRGFGFTCLAPFPWSENEA